MTEFRTELNKDLRNLYSKFVEYHEVCGKREGWNVRAAIADLHRAGQAMGFSPELEEIE